MIERVVLTGTGLSLRMEALKGTVTIVFYGTGLVIYIRVFMGKGLLD